MLLLPFLALVLCFFVTDGEGLPDGESLDFTIKVEQSQINATVGGNALLEVQPSGNISSGSWSFNGKTVCQWIGELVSMDNSYTSRADLFISSGSLQLKMVEKSDSGEYIVNMVPTRGLQTSATITLQVTKHPNSLSGGAIGGIVIGCVAGVVMASGFVFWYKRRKASRCHGRITRHHLSGPLQSLPLGKP
ncbi:carcinoembryonic antigen-related cell adhesion molecule 1-like isoform X2 [Hypanus sabinus]|uniref:carcinoembryonic antigen-related cell adhesion molecule 1-like isoform X2 n=1 Tax=Hypanus sabinus TaxID=79690 RepID=UPI0028C3CD92|nr:carcinoembryonic antigen-related cell adhesion molecule 1-like isoform X2 [Hypanus sabinus]